MADKPTNSSADFARRSLELAQRTSYGNHPQQKTRQRALVEQTRETLRLAEIGDRTTPAGRPRK